MSLPVVSGREVIKALSKKGFSWRPGKGSHMVAQKPNHPIIFSVPLHDKLKRGTLKNILNAAGVTTQEFIELLK